MVLVKQLKIKWNNKKEDFLGILAATLVSRLLRNVLGGKEEIRADEGRTRAGEEVIRAAQDF